MDAQECIKTRRTVRSFTDEAVTKEDIEKIVALAAFAPSWKNTQTSRYIAVLDKAQIEKIAAEGTMGFDWNKGIIEHAPALVVLTTINEISGYEKDGSFSTSKGAHWQSFDSGVAAQTFCLAAHSLGLGSGILGIFDAEKIAEMINVPDTQSVSAIIVLGHPAKKNDAPPRLDTETLLSFR